MKRHTIFLLTAFLSMVIQIWAQEPAFSSKQDIVDAVKKGDVAAVKKMLDTNTTFGINDVVDQWRFTLLMHAVCKVQPDVVELLLARGADPTIRAKDGFTVLDTVSSNAYSGPQKSKEEQLQFMRLQKRSEDDIKKWLQQYEQQYSPEMLKKREKIKNLIEKTYADKEKQGNKSPLWNAIAAGDLPKVEALFAGGVISNINMQNDKGETPLIVAVKNGHYDIAKLLLSNGANIGIMDNQKETAYSYAQKMLELLVQERQKRDIQAYKELVSKQAFDLNKKDKNGETLLMRAVAEGNLDITRVLLAAGSNPTVKNNQGQTLKDIACTRGQYLTHKKLIIDLLDGYLKGDSSNIPEKDLKESQDKSGSKAE